MTAKNSLDLVTSAKASNAHSLRIIVLKLFGRQDYVARHSTTTRWMMTLTAEELDLVIRVMNHVELGIEVPAKDVVAVCDLYAAKFPSH